MALVGALVVVVATSAGALRRGDGAAELSRLAFRGLLLGVLPAYLVMRVGAEWIAAEQDWGGDPAWIGIGYMTADAGLLVTIVATVLAWRAAKRATGGRAVVVLCGVLLVAYAVAIWAMTNKPD
jgi:hypothetical protein